VSNGRIDFLFIISPFKKWLIVSPGSVPQNKSNRIVSHPSRKSRITLSQSRWFGGIFGLYKKGDFLRRTPHKILIFRQINRVKRIVTVGTKTGKFWLLFLKFFSVFFSPSPHQSRAVRTQLATGTSGINRPISTLIVTASQRPVAELFFNKDSQIIPVDDIITNPMLMQLLHNVPRHTQNLPEMMRCILYLSLNNSEVDFERSPSTCSLSSASRSPSSSISRKICLYLSVAFNLPSISAIRTVMRNTTVLIQSLNSAIQETTPSRPNTSNYEIQLYVFGLRMYISGVSKWKPRTVIIFQYKICLRTKNVITNDTIKIK